MEVDKFTECHNCRNKFPNTHQFQQCDICKLTDYCSIDCKTTHYPIHKLTCNENDKFIVKKMRRDMDAIFENIIFMDLLYALNHHWKPYELKCVITKNNSCCPLKTKLFEEFFICEITCTESENSNINIIYNGINNISQSFTLTCDCDRSKLIYELHPQFGLDKLTENNLLFVVSNNDFCAFQILDKPVTMRINPVK